MGNAQFCNNIMGCFRCVECRELVYYDIYTRIKDNKQMDGVYYQNRRIYDYSPIEEEMDVGMLYKQKNYCKKCHNLLKF